MIRRASSASSGRTAIRTSPSSLTFSGNTECATEDDSTDMTPCASSRPRTMLASTSDCVRKMTTSSAHPRTSATSATSAASASRSPPGGGTCVDLQQDHRHVVVLRRVADERRDLAQHAFAQLVGRADARAPRSAWPSRCSPKQSSPTFIASLIPSVKNRYRSPAAAESSAPPAAARTSRRCRVFRPSTMPVRRQDLNAARLRCSAPGR